MFSARLNDLHRTTSFRLALLFLLLFGSCSIALFAFLHWQIETYVTDKVNEGLQREQNGFIYLRREAALERLNARVMAEPRLDRPFTLFDAAGRRIAGSRIDLPGPVPADLPQDIPFSFTQLVGGQQVPFHGQVHRMQSGEYLLIAQDMTGVMRLSEFMIGSLISGGLVTTVVGLVGAAIAGAGAVRQIDAVTRATRNIINGDLSGRLPTSGGSADLDRLSAVINHMLEEIERLMQEVKGVCDNIAHDLRTPLTRLLAGLERAHRRSVSAAEYAEAVEEAIDETKAVLRTFAAMLRIAEVEGGARRAGFTAVDLRDIVTDVVELYEPIAEEKGIDLRHHSADIPVMTKGDPNLLFEAVGNLVDNALKFTPRAGSVDVSTFANSDELGVEVTDTGPGIPEQERHAVLRRFYRTEESRHTAGSGLGLPLVAAVARLHGMDLVMTDTTEGLRIAILRNFPGLVGQEPGG